MKKYDYKSDIVISIQQLVKRKYSNIFFGVFVHGSVAEDVIIPYSDFDGLVVVKKQFLGSKIFRSFIRTL